MSRKLLLLGGGGHCRSVIDCALSMGIFSEIGIVDNTANALHVDGVVGSDEDLPILFEQGWTDAFISVGSIGNTAVRRKLYNLIKESGFNVPVIADPTACLARNAFIGAGTFIGKKAVVNTAAIVGECCIINSGSIVEHDCSIGEFSHVSPGSVLCGGVKVGKDSHIGAGSIVKQSVSIGNNVLIGAGSLVLKDLPDRVKAFGSPCRVVE